MFLLLVESITRQSHLLTLDNSFMAVSGRLNLETLFLLLILK